MKINPKLLPIKGHYFFFLGCVSPVLPFMMVVVRQLGIPVLVQGSVGSFILVFTVLLKPLIAGAADAFPKARKAIFILILVLMVSSLCSIAFLPPMHGYEHTEIQGRVIGPSGMDNRFYKNSHHYSTNYSDILGKDDLQSELKQAYLLAITKDGCYVNEAWDCKAVCQFPELCSEDLPMIAPRILLNEKNILPLLNASWEYNHIYLLENMNFTSAYNWKDVKFTCRGGLYVGAECQSIWVAPVFWLYLVLFTIGQVSFASSNSISDAICLDTVGSSGDYGGQRAWGTVGWGLMGPISGFIVDWYSGDNVGKNYSPAFFLLFALGSIDILLSMAKLKVPRIEDKTQVWETVKPLLKTPQFVVFLLFVILNGSFDGAVASYIFVLQEEMAEKGGYVRHMKFIQGLTLGVQCFFEAPFMWVCGWFLKKLGAAKLMSLVLFLYIFRLFGLALVGTYGPVWATLVTEILNGPCYGLGYTAIVVQAGLLTPPGTSATVQSLANICYESLGYALASLLGGVIYTVLGGPGIYYVFGGISVVTFFLHYFTINWLRKLEHKTRDKKSNLEVSKEDSLLPSSPEEKEVSLLGDEKEDKNLKV